MVILASYILDIIGGTAELTNLVTFFGEVHHTIRDEDSFLALLLRVGQAMRGPNDRPPFRRSNEMTFFKYHLS